MNNVFILILFLVSVVGEVYRWCDPYETFCLFSFGPNVTVSNQEEAQQICSQASNRSWLLEIKSNEEFHVAKNFKIKVSLMKNIDVIIDHKSIKREELINDGFLKMNQIKKREKGVHSKYGVVCMTECSAQWKVYNKGFDKNKEKCTEMCEKHKSCTAVESNSKLYYPCWMYTTNDAPPDSSEFEGEAFYIIDRTMKTTENCIGNLTETNGDIKTNKTISEGVMIYVLVFIIGLSIISAIYVMKRCKATTTSLTAKKFQRIEQEIIRFNNAEWNLEFSNMATDDPQFLQCDFKENEIKRFRRPNGDIYTLVSHKINTKQ